jgi:hypothetical protein
VLNRWVKLPQWRCAKMVGGGLVPCDRDATWRSRWVQTSATWTCWCDEHKPDNAEPIPPDAEWHEVTLIVEVTVGELASGQPDAVMDKVLRKVHNTLEDLGCRCSVVKTASTFHAATASTGLRLRFAESGGGGGTLFPERVSNRPLRASLRRHEKKRGTG